MLMEKRLQLILMQIADSQEGQTSEQLARFVGVSSRTIKGDIKRINEILADYGAEIIAKRGRGYTFVIHDTDLYQQFLDLIRKDEQNTGNIPQSRMQRVNYIIMKMLIVDYYIKIDDFAEELYIDRSTFSSCLKEVKIILQKYHLWIEHAGGRGIIIRGSELNIRICIAEYFFHNSLISGILSEDNTMLADLERQNEIKKIKDILRNVLDMNEIQISSYSFENMIIHIIVALRRWVLYNYMKITDEQYAFTGNSRYLCAGEQLVKALEKENSIMVPHDEAIYFAIHFQTKHIATNTSFEAENLPDEAFFNDLFQEIEKVYGICFHQDQELIHLLKMHLPAMLSRLQLHLPLRSLTLYDYFRKYLFAYKITDVAAAKIKEHFHLDMEINEFGFLVLYFNWALQRIHRRYRMKLLLLCGSGRPESIMLINEISERYKQIVEAVDLADLNELKTKQLSQYDVIITTMQLHTKIDKPILYLSYQQEEQMKLLDNEITRLYYLKMNLLSLFQEDIITYGIEGNTKYAVMEHIYSTLADEQLKKEWKDITEKEKTLSSEIGNSIAVFHTCEHHNPLFFHIYVLKKSIIWDKQFVEIMIWIGANPDEQERCWLLMDVLSKWACDYHSVSHFLRLKNFEAFLNGIKKAMNSLT